MSRGRSLKREKRAGMLSNLVSDLFVVGKDHLSKFLLWLMGVIPGNKTVMPCSPCWPQTCSTPAWTSWELESPIKHWFLINNYRFECVLKKTVKMEILETVFNVRLKFWNTFWKHWVPIYKIDGSEVLH